MENKLRLIDETKVDGETASLLFMDDSENLKIRIKWDGCCDIVRYYNGGEDEDNIHVCGLKEFIDFLTEAYKTAESKGCEV